MITLREPGAVLLVSCYELGHQPAGLAVPMAFLERAGFRPAALDLAVEPLDEGRVLCARLVAISVPMHTALRIGARAAERIRALRPDAVICFHGLYALLNRDWLIERHADAVLGGECEEDLVALARSLERGERPRPTPTPPRLGRLDFPVPSRSGLPALARYAAFESGGERKVAGAVEASRGCLHECRHCPIPPVYGGRFFVVPPEIVLEDIRRQVAAGAEHITFTDPDFLNGPRHALRIAEAMHAEHPDLSFDFTAKIEHLLRHRDLLARFASSGCAFVVSAVESLSDLVLRRLDKGHTKADVQAALAITRSAGITLRPSLLPFTPWSTVDDYVELVDWVAHEDLADSVDPVHWTIRLLIPPGSLLLATPEIRPFLEGGALDRENYTWTWTHPDPEMERLYRTVSGLVLEASHAGEPAAVTFQRVRAAAYTAAGRRPIEAEATHAERRPVAPRLTEPWFC
jgi:radical SAM superfamily enzyme YgiQ (UPF0313 family)